MTLRQGALIARLQHAWWLAKPAGLSQALRPLAAVYRVLSAWQQRRLRRLAEPLPVPVLVVGNLIVGGAGKTPTTIALIHALQQRGWRTGVVSRGYGRDDPSKRPACLAVSASAKASDTGDEPLLIHLRTGAPVWVGQDRSAAARELLAAHPDTDLIIADDGLQHWRLARDLQLIVFDARGAGNGLMLPAGPLREPLPDTLPPQTWVLYNADKPSTHLAGDCARRGLSQALPLADWWAGHSARADSLAQLREASRARPMLAAAGMADPERFFAQLEAQGLRIQRLPLADHASFRPLPWPANTRCVLLTEKDAVKLRPEAVGTTQVWVLTLDFELPARLVDDIDRQLRICAATRPTAIPIPSRPHP